MWQQEKKDSLIVSLALLLALATIPTTATPLLRTPALAQSPTQTPAFPLPQSVANGTIVRIDGAQGLAAINQGLKQSFEQQFSGTTVQVASNGTDAALKGLLDGNVDLVILSRGLTPEEKAQGLEQVRLRREKIAVFVGAENPFRGSLTSRQFARMFRGQIGDWSQLGRAKGQIRLIDRPANNDTRNNLRSYPAFKNASFATGDNATQLADDNITAVIPQLGKDGISYALASQVSQLAKLQSVRLINIDEISPDDDKYPFSQPLVYVYKQNPNPGIAAFLGFAIASPGQKAIDEARVAEANAISTNSLQALPADNIASPVAESTTAQAPSPFTQATTAPTTAPTEQPATTPTQSSPNNINPALLLWLLLPVIGGFLLWWFLGRSSEDKEQEESPTGEASPTENTTADVVATPNQISPAPSHLTHPVTIINNSHNSDAGDSAWDIETPATVVSNSYPQLPDVPLVASDTELAKAETSSSITQLIEIPEVALDTDIWSDEPPQPARENQLPTEANIVEHSIPTADTTPAPDIWSAIADTESDTPDLPELTLDTELPNVPASSTAAELPELPEVDLNAVADAAELTGDFPEEDAIEIVSDIPQTTNSATSNFVEAVSIGTGAGIYGQEDTVAANAPVASRLVISSPDVENEASIVLTLQSPGWADVSWYIPEEQRQALLSSGVSQLTLRLCDVTGLDLSYQSPQLVQDYEVEALIKDRLIAIPETERDYVAEIGYVKAEEWVMIARSAIAHVFSPIAEQTDTTDTPQEKVTSIVLTPQSAEWVDVAWQIPDSQQAVLQKAGVSELILRLYDVTGLDLSHQTPPVVQQYTDTKFAHHRLIPIPATERDYITEIGYIVDGDRWVSIARSEIVRILSPVPQDTAPTKASITLTPESFEWVYTSWHIPPEEKQALEHAGVSELTLRLSDVTGLDLSYQSPQLIAEYAVGELIKDRFVAIPATQRNYITEIGYIKDGQWVSIARSEIVRIFKPVPTDADNITASIVLKADSSELADVCWHIPEPQQQALANVGVSQITLRLYDITGLDLSYQNPQLVQEYPGQELSHNRALPIPTTERDYITEIGYIKDEEWLPIARSAVVRFFNPVPVEPAKIEARIDLKPHTPKWAYVSWDIPEPQRQALQKLEVSELTLRLYDVTGVDLTHQSPHLVQAYEIDILIKDRFVGIPATEHDYITEIGYVKDGEWVLIARSRAVRISSHLPVDTPTDILSDVNTEASIVLAPRTPKWAYVSWQIPEAQKVALQNSGVAQLTLRLYDTTDIDLSYQTPQLVQQYGCEEVTNDRFVAIPTTDRDYIIEVGYVAAGDRWVPIARSSSVRVFSRPQTEFWFVADAELIIHGATQPNATVTTGGNTIKLKPDGTFHLRIPLFDNDIEYLLTAVAANGQEVKTIGKKLSQDDPQT